MTIPTQRTWIVALAIATLGLVGLGAAAGFHYLNPQKSIATLDPNEIRELLHNPDLTAEDRRALYDKMREYREREMAAHVDEFFAATDDAARQAVLDRHIDEMQRQIAEREARRREAEARNAAEKEKKQRGRDYNSMTTQEKKERAESGNPDKRAKTMTYFEALRARMNARGIQPPRGPGGPGRGPGGPGGERP